MDKEAVLKAKEEKSVIYEKAFFPVDLLPDWGSFMFHIEDKIHTSAATKYDSVEGFGGRTVGDVNFWDSISISTSGLDKKHYKNIDILESKLKDLHPGTYRKNIMFVNLASKPTDLEHADEYDVFFVQCIGSVVWKIKNGSDYVLEPGDAIFVPTTVIHEVVPLSPRASLSFTFNA